MDLLVFIPTMDQPGRRLQRVIGNLVWQGTIEIFRTIKKISSRLRHLTGEETVVILLVSSPKELDELTADLQLFINFRVILILPDGTEDTIAKGHRLRPRFLAHRDSDFSDVSRVLQKMDKAARSARPLFRGGKRISGVLLGPLSPSVIKRAGDAPRSLSEKGVELIGEVNNKGG